MTAQQQAIVLVGYGNMGRALASGWMEDGSSEIDLRVVDPKPEARALAKSQGLIAVDSAAKIEGPIAVAVLAVKPAEIDVALTALPPAQLYISIAAGRTIGQIADVVGSAAAIVRAMPNTPAAIGLGVTGLCANAAATQSDRALASHLLAAVGTIEWLDDEDDMDALTAVSGSGPAYVFLLIECLISAAIDAGLEPELARRLAVGTVRGAGAYAAASTVDVASLRRQVTSPKGTTAAALDVLMAQDALKRLVGAAVAEAKRRSRELRTIDNPR
jgi:pyrroline-5-carboxylate reductase